MKTENTANENVETVTTEETSPVVSAGLEGVDGTTDMETLLDQEGEEALPDARRYKDFSATVSALPSAARFNIAKVIASILLAAFIIGVGTHAWQSFHDRKSGSDSIGCYAGRKLSGDVPASFEGDLKAYKSAGGDVLDLGPCGQGKPAPVQPKS